MVIQPINNFIQSAWSFTREDGRESEVHSGGRGGLWGRGSVPGGWGDHSGQ